MRKLGSYTLCRRELLLVSLITVSQRNNVERVNNGQWNLRNQTFFIPATIGKFAVFCFAKRNEISGQQIEYTYDFCYSFVVIVILCFLFI